MASSTVAPGAVPPAPGAGTRPPDAAEAPVGAPTGPDAPARVGTPHRAFPHTLEGEGKMLTAINTRNRAPITALAYKALDRAHRPTALTCPGHAPTGAPCSATVHPCALDSTKMGPYFRVENLTDHIDDCSELTGELPPISKHDPYLVGVRGTQGPTGPRRVIDVITKHPLPHIPATPTKAPARQRRTEPGHHRAPAPPRPRNEPTRIRAGLRKIAADHAAGLYADDDLVRVTKDKNGKGTVRSRIYTADRLIRAPYKDRTIIAYGPIASISEGDIPDTFFIRLARPGGGRTKVSIMLNSTQTRQIRDRLDLDAVLRAPTKWTVVALGTIGGRTMESRHLDPHDAFSVEFDAAPPSP